MCWLDMPTWTIDTIQSIFLSTRAQCNLCPVMPFHPVRKTSITKDKRGKKRFVFLMPSKLCLCVCGKGEKQKSIKQRFIIMLRIWKRAIEYDEGTTSDETTKNTHIRRSLEDRTPTVYHLMKTTKKT